MYIHMDFDTPQNFLKYCTLCDFCKVFWDYFDYILEFSTYTGIFNMVWNFFDNPPRPSKGRFLI